MRAVDEIEIDRAFTKKINSLLSDEYYSNPVEIRWSTEKLTEYMIAELKEVKGDIIGRCKSLT